MTQEFLNFFYLFSAVAFILSIKGLSSPSSAKTGNLIGILGMVVALIAMFCTKDFHNHIVIISTILSGGAVGIFIVRNIPMTGMPQLIAGFHSFVGLCATLTAYCAFFNPESFGIGLFGMIPHSILIEMSLGASIGAITFTGSLVAFGKLQGILSHKPIKFYGQQYISFIILLTIFIWIGFLLHNSSALNFNIIVLLSFALGILLIISIGGADMPVVISMLNAYSGWAAVGIGFTLSNILLIVTGAIVGSSGTILSFIMCKAMNRSIINVVFGAFLKQNTNISSEMDSEKAIKHTTAEEVAFLLENSSSLIIVPGYGMAVSGAQHAVREITNLLESKGVTVKFAIHPVAGRMPGHMNVLLAESGIDYDQVFELEEINNDFISTDVVLVVGANDITNPAAKNDPSSPIYGMPILEVANARTVVFIKRSMSSGYAGIENDLFFTDNTLMLFGDAKKVIEEMSKNLKSGN